MNLCKDCKHRMLRIFSGQHLCEASKLIVEPKTDPVSGRAIRGKTLFKKCWYARNTNSGPSGTLFQPKKNPSGP